MNAPPEANTEYSRGSGPSRRLILPRWDASETAPATPADPPRAASVATAVLALLGALLIVIAQFTALYRVHTAASSAAIKTVGAGANHAWAPLPLALLAAALALAVLRSRSRSAAAAIAVLGIATLGVALLGDLPDVHASGLVGSSAGGYVQATASPSAGLYMETLGAVLLLIAGGVGLLMLVAPRRNPAP